MSQEPPKENKPFYFFHLEYEGSVEEFKKLLKKKIGFDFKDIVIIIIFNIFLIILNINLDIIFLLL